jgi:hypothetical protein
VAEICVAKGSTGNANETLVDEPAIDERPVAVDGRPVANHNVDDDVVEIDRDPNPRAGGGVGGADVVDDIIVHGSSSNQTWTGDKSSSELLVKLMMSIADLIISKLCARQCLVTRVSVKGKKDDEGGNGQTSNRRAGATFIERATSEAYSSLPSNRRAQLPRRSPLHRVVVVVVVSRRVVIQFDRRPV